MGYPSCSHTLPGELQRYFKHLVSGQVRRLCGYSAEVLSREKDCSLNEGITELSLLEAIQQLIRKSVSLPNTYFSVPTSLIADKTSVQFCIMPQFVI